MPLASRSGVLTLGLIWCSLHCGGAEPGKGTEIGNGGRGGSMPTPVAGALRSVGWVGGVEGEPALPEEELPLVWASASEPPARARAATRAERERRFMTRPFEESAFEPPSRSATAVPARDGRPPTARSLRVS